MSFDLESFEKFKKCLNKHKIYFAFNEFLEGDENFYIFIQTEFIDLFVEDFTIENFNIYIKSSCIGTIITYSYYISVNENDIFNIRNFIKLFNIDIKNTNIEEFIKNINYFDLLKNENFIKSIENLNLEFM